MAIQSLHLGRLVAILDQVVLLRCNTRVATDSLLSWPWVVEGERVGTVATPLLQVDLPADILASELKYIDNRNSSQLGCSSQQEVYNDSLLEVRVTAEESILILRGESSVFTVGVRSQQEKFFEMFIAG